jgi:DNA-binding LytR/AlgR family response regulator
MILGTNDLKTLHMEQHDRTPSTRHLSFSNPDQPIPIGGFEKVFTQEVLFCQGDRNYTHVHLINGRKITVSNTLAILEERLEVGEFLRIARGRLVNKQYIRHYDGLTITLSNGTVIGVARRRRHEVRVSLGLFSEKFHIKNKRCD